jgi:hypothetical protein
MKKLFLLSSVFMVLLNFSVAKAEETKKIDLMDLGFEKKAFEISKEDQLKLQEREFKLQRHQLMGYVTSALLLGAVLAAPEGEEADSSHIGLGAAAGLSYAYTAYLALSAPTVPGHGKTGWGTKIHKSLVWIHMPAMVLLPFAAVSANNSRKDGKSPSGIGKYHKDLGGIALASVLTAAISMTIEF